MGISRKMAHSEHNKAKKKSYGFMLIIFGALLLFIAPNIYNGMPELGVASLVFGFIFGGIGFYVRFLRKAKRV